MTTFKVGRNYKCIESFFGLNEMIFFKKGEIYKLVKIEDNTYLFDDVNNKRVWLYWTSDYQLKNLSDNRLEKLKRILDDD